jgi:hypothetical protein
MNPRLLTPAIVLISFGAAFGLTGWHAGLWRAAAANAPANVPSVPTPTPAAQVAPPPVVTPDADPAPEVDSPAAVPPATQAAQTEGFLDARDRAADHGARSH